MLPVDQSERARILTRDRDQLVVRPTRPSSTTRTSATKPDMAEESASPFGDLSLASREAAGPSRQLARRKARCRPFDAALAEQGDLPIDARADAPSDGDRHSLPRVKPPVRRKPKVLGRHELGRAPRPGRVGDLSLARAPAPPKRPRPGSRIAAPRTPARASEKPSSHVSQPPAAPTLAALGPDIVAATTRCPHRGERQKRGRPSGHGWSGPVPAGTVGLSRVSTWFPDPLSREAARLAPSSPRVPLELRGREVA
jgi:hypothetical protein